MEWIFFFLIIFIFSLIEQKKNKKEEKAKDKCRIDNIVAKRNIKKQYNKPTKAIKKKIVQQEPIDIYKLKGDKYEKYVGAKFEDQNHLVIYNGFINGMYDKGIDLIVISNKRKAVNLVQCKNWDRKQFTISELETIYHKLNNFQLKNFNISSSEILKYLQIKKDNEEIKNTIKNLQTQFNKYDIKKTLYISSDKVIDLKIGKYLTMIKHNHFRYNDMKIVIQRLD
ncbi:MAG TPA: hypothetical protein EYG80_01860 [Flavobacteriaceae bacterium]|nr:hypothetical protein [Flavobacteriaceae bacterium]